MEKFLKNFFGFLKSSVHFIKVADIFLILMLLLYWIQNLIDGHWGWIDVFKPFLDSLLYIGTLVSDGALDLFGAVFEFKYIIAVIILIAFYFLLNFLDVFVDRLEDLVDDGRRAVNKISEDVQNTAMQMQNESEQSKINKYYIYVATSIKKKFSHKELGIDIEEQNRLMNKFLIEKLGVAPAKYNEGFLYQFNSFSNIDNVLQVFFKVLKSNSPLNYYIVVQVNNGDATEDYNNINKLGSLMLENKICMMPDTAYRYKFNKAHRYGVSQLGLYQKGDSTIEVSEFVEIL